VAWRTIASAGPKTQRPAGWGGPSRSGAPGSDQNTTKPGRKARTKEILADLSSAFQIIIFTHSPEYDDWGKVVEI